jgi:hypothetical protein
MRTVIAKWTKQILSWGSKLHATKTVTVHPPPPQTQLLQHICQQTFLKETLKIMREMPVMLHCRGQFRKKYFPTQK